MRARYFLPSSHVAACPFLPLSFLYYRYLARARCPCWYPQALRQKSNSWTFKKYPSKYSPVHRSAHPPNDRNLPDYQPFSVVPLLLPLPLKPSQHPSQAIISHGWGPSTKMAPYGHIGQQKGETFFYFFFFYGWSLPIVSIFKILHLFGSLSERRYTYPVHSFHQREAEVQAATSAIDHF